MDAAKSSQKPSFGFLTVRRHSHHGFFGGYLIVNEVARPLEFHCTLPVQPTRAQQILFGATLHEFICGEQIARAMVNKGKCKPTCLITDGPAVLSLRNLIDIPIYYLENDPKSIGAESMGIPIVDRDETHYECIRIGGVELATLRPFSKDTEVVRRVVGTEGTWPIDLAEPFARIVEAIGEAHPSTKAA